MDLTKIFVDCKVMGSIILHNLIRIFKMTHDKVLIRLQYYQILQEIASSL